MESVASSISGVADSRKIASCRRSLPKGGVMKSGGRLLLAGILILLAAATAWAQYPAAGTQAGDPPAAYPQGSDPQAMGPQGGDSNAGNPQALDPPGRVARLQYMTGQV